MSTRALIAVSLIATAVAVSAAPAGTPKGAPAAHSGSSMPPSGPNQKEKLVATYDAVGNGEAASLPQYTYTTIATSTVKCGAAGGCSVGIEAMAQLAPVGGDWSICLLIDGSSVSCQYQGIQGSTSGWVVGNARGWGTVSKGSHTVTTQLYVEGSGAYYAYYQTDSRVYTP